MFYVGVYVDDIILARRSELKLKEVKSDLSGKFNTKDLGILNYFLGMKIEHNELNGSVLTGQCAYTESLLEKFGMKDCNPISLKLTHATDKDDCINQPQYQSAIGSLMYLSVSQIYESCQLLSKIHI